jgi:hypothetical protein
MTIELHAGMSHRAMIEAMLHNAGHRGVCATWFLKNYMPTYSQRIGELKRKGLKITTKVCDREGHSHNSRQLIYVLEKED